MDTEGRIPFRGHETWYRSVGPDDGDAIPLLCLHGGPGANWLHVKPYEVLADERSRDVKAKLSRDHELIYPPIQEFWDAAVSGTS